MIAKVDEFILYDDVQYVKRHWHNRNKIRTAQGTQWLTIPVNSKGKYLQNIDETEVSENWADKHWRTLRHTYHKSPYFSQYEQEVDALYQKASELKLLSDINALFLSKICQIIGLDTKISRSKDYPAQGIKTDRLLSICQQAKASHYLSGPAAQSYFEMEKFQAARIDVEWMDYSGYPEYSQIYDGFDHAVTILDLLFQTGDKVLDFMKAGKK